MTGKCISRTARKDVTGNKVSLTEFCEDIKNFTCEVSDKVPEGWFSVTEVAAAMGRSDIRARIKMVKMMERGLVERRRFRVETTSKGMLRSMYYYRPIKPGRFQTKDRGSRIDAVVSGVV